MNPDPERRNDSWAPVRYGIPRETRSAARGLPGQRISIHPHNVLDGGWERHLETTVEQAVVDKVVLTGKGWPPGVAAVDWWAGDTAGRTMFGWGDLPGLYGGCHCSCGNSGARGSGGAGCAGANAGNGGSHCRRPGQCAS